MSKSLHTAAPCILAIDFDNTITSSNSYPHIEGLKPFAQKYIDKLAREGYYIIIWTCRSGEAQELAKQFLIDNAIVFHQINQHHPTLVEFYRNDTRKISADIYIDDKGLEDLPASWAGIYELIKKKTDNLQTKVLEYAIEHNSD